LILWIYDVKDLEVIEAVRPAVEENEDEPAPKKRIITKKVQVKVGLEKKTNDKGEAPYALDEVKFCVWCDEPKFEFHGTDIECLRQAAWEQLDKKYEIKWESYFLVTVNHATDYGGGFSTGLTFSYNDVKKGTTHDGKELLKQFGWRGEQEIKPWPGRFEDKGGRAIACIPDTEANKTALEEFCERINLLRNAIRDTIRPENIVKTLMHMASLSILPKALPENTDDTSRDNPESQDA
jgi:hypothetical protein